MTLRTPAALADRVLLLGGAPGRIVDDIRLERDAEQFLRTRLADLRAAA